MNTPLHAPATIGTQTLRALGRYPERIAFSWDGGSLTGAATLDLIGRMQNVFWSARCGRGQRVAVLTANRVETWCAGIAAQLSALSTTPLHPLGSLEDQLDQIADSEAEVLVVDAKTFGPRGGELAARSAGLKRVFTIGPAEFGTDLVAAAEDAGTTTPRDLSGIDDIAALNYTGGTTGKSKGALRRHRELAPFASSPRNQVRQGVSRHTADPFVVFGNGSRRSAAHPPCPCTQEGDEILWEVTVADRFELRAIFEVEDRKKLLTYARRRHRECYPRGTRYAPPLPRDVTDAIVESLIESKEGPSPEEFGLSYLESVTGPVEEREALALDKVRTLYARAGGAAAGWEALEKLLELLLTPEAGPSRTRRPRESAGRKPGRRSH